MRGRRRPGLRGTARCPAGPGPTAVGHLGRPPACPAAARGASAPAAPGRPSAGRTAPSGCRGTAPPASRRAGPARSAARRRTGCVSSVNGSDSRSSSSRSSGARPSSSSLIELSWISRSRARVASSSGAARTSSSSCLIIVPIRMTLAGCSTMLPTALLLVTVLARLRHVGHAHRAAVRPDDHDLLLAVLALLGARSWLRSRRVGPTVGRQRPGHRSSTLPMTPPSSSTRALRRRPASGTSACTIGRTRPSAIIGHTCSRTAATIAALPRAGHRPAAQARRDDAAPLGQQRADVELALRRRPASR